MCNNHTFFLCLLLHLSKLFHEAAIVSEKIYDRRCRCLYYNFLWLSILSAYFNKIKSDYNSIPKYILLNKFMLISARQRDLIIGNQIMVCSSVLKTPGTLNHHNTTHFDHPC